VSPQTTHDAPAGREASRAGVGTRPLYEEPVPAQSTAMRGAIDTANRNVRPAQLGAAAGRRRSGRRKLPTMLW
jgi:hypothetical protein